MNISNKQLLLISVLSGLLLGIAIYYLTKPDATERNNASLFGFLQQSKIENPPAIVKASFHQAVVDALPAVVSVYTEQTQTVQPKTNDPLFNNLFGENGKFPLNQVSTTQGSGVIFSQDGYIITNEHLVSNADKISIILSEGSQYDAEFIGADEITDIAVLKITSQTPLPQIRLAPNQTPLVGDIVLAIGNPYGFGQTVTMGIVSATGRGNIAGTPLQDFIQIDAAINPGNSGGPLINPQGELIGINTAVYAPDGGAQGIGFALPVRLVNYVVPQLIEKMQVSRGWIGLQADDLHYHPQLHSRFKYGIVVTGVFQKSPAAMAGLKRGDIITHFNDQPVYSARQMMLETTTTSPSKEVTITGIRQQEAFKLSVTLAARPE